MALYCYIVETGYYDDREANILGHKNKYSHKEFDNICIEITKKYGDVEEVEYFSNYDLTDVEEIKYNIDAYELIKYLVSDYGFIELNVPVNDGFNVEEVSRKPVPPENLRIVKTKSQDCPIKNELMLPSLVNDDSDFRESEITCDSDFNGVCHVNARCFTGKRIPVFKKR